MALSIKNEETEKLARELAQVRGMSMTAAVTEALREALLRLRGRRRVPVLRERLARIAERCAALPDRETRSADEILGYDGDGAPR